MRFYWSSLGALAVWRISHLLALEDGPWQLAARIRRGAGDGFWGGLLDCIYCLSLWVALPVAALLATGWRERLLMCPALSAAAVLLERATQSTQPEPATAPALGFAEQEEQQETEEPDVLLW